MAYIVFRPATKSYFVETNTPGSLLDGCEWGSFEKAHRFASRQPAVEFVKAESDFEDSVLEVIDESQPALKAGQ